jgi:hypothetical protein
MSEYRPQCDSMVERVNRTLIDIIAWYLMYGRLTRGKDDWMPQARNS